MPLDVVTVDAVEGSTTVDVIVPRPPIIVDVIVAVGPQGPPGNEGITPPPGGTAGQVQYNAAGSFGGFTVSGDATLNTSTGALTVSGLQGRGVASTAPTSSQVLAWSGTQWAPATPAAGGVTSITAGTGLSGGTITTSGTIGLQTPVQISNGGTGATSAASALLNLGGISGNQTITLSGDLGGSGATAIAGIVTGLQGRPVANTAPSTNYVLTWSGTQWAPAAVGGTGTVTSISAGTGITVSPSPITGSGSVALTVPVAATSGGTGLATYAQGDMLYASAANTLSALAKDSNATRYLSNTGATNSPAWAQVNLGNGVTGGLLVANGGTGVTAPTQGDMLFYSGGSTYNRLLKDTNATRYISNTGASNNPAWAQINLTNGVTGTLPVANGGTGVTTAAAAPWVEVAGDTMTGALTINQNAAALPAVSGLGSVPLQIGGADGQHTTLVIDTFGTQQSPLFVGRQAHGTAAAKTATQVGDRLCSLLAMGWTGSNYVISADLECWTDDNFSGTASGAHWNFSTTAQGATGQVTRAILQRGLMICNASGAVPTGGDLGAGTINAASDVVSGGGIMTNNTGRFGAGTYDALQTYNGASATYAMACRWGGSAIGGGGTLIGSITTTSSSVSFNTTSDIRLKADIEPLLDASDILDKLKPIKFRWRNSDEGENPEGFGFAAQEAHEVFPQAVTLGKGEPGDENFAPWMMDHSKMVPLLVRAVQQLTARVAELEGSKS